MSRGARYLFSNTGLRFLRLDIATGEFGLAVILGGARRDLVAGEGANAVEQLPLLRRQRVKPIEERGHAALLTKNGNGVPFLFVTEKDLATVSGAAGVCSPRLSRRERGMKIRLFLFLRWGRFRFRVRLRL